MFSQGSKLAVLESKLGIYEELSREMLSKLESSVDKITEVNSRIATILAKHDEKIEQSVKTDEIIIGMIDELKNENKEDHKLVVNRIQTLEKVVEELKKFKWQVGGVFAVAVVISGALNSFIPTLLTYKSQPVIVEKYLNN